MELLELERKLNERPEQSDLEHAEGSVDQSDTDSDMVILSESLKVKPLEPLKTLPDIKIPV